MKEYHLIDKTGWGNGPWKSEPDYVVWVDFDTFYPCTARRNVLGAWCGYVGLAPHHPLYRVGTPDRAYEFLDCHGGISFAGLAVHDSLQFTPPIRHWWVGFDAMGDGDMIPDTSGAPAEDAPEQSRPKRGRRKKAESMLAYRDLEYIRNEVGLLAMQLSNIDGKIVFADLKTNDI